MGLIFRKQIRVGKTGKINISKSGVSGTKRFGPLTVNTRGRGSLRIAKGISWRF